MLLANHTGISNARRHVLLKVAHVALQLDTGNSTLGEIEAAVEVIARAGNERIIIHHCPSGYPARRDGINLRVIQTLKAMFAYLRTLAPVKHTVDNSLPPTPCPVCKTSHGGGDKNHRVEPASYSNC